MVHLYQFHPSPIAQSLSRINVSEKHERNTNLELKLRGRNSRDFKGVEIFNGIILILLPVLGNSFVNTGVDP